MRKAIASALVVAASWGSGCGSEAGPLPPGCRVAPSQVYTALRAAPGLVRLPGGARLSTCVKRAREDAELQNVGASYTQTADALARQLSGSDAAALRLGYLIAATRRGASTTNGIATELVRRLEQTTGLDGPPAARRSAFERGIRAGKRSG